MESFSLQDWTRIGAMNPFLQGKPKRQRTGAVQHLAEARKHVVLACVLECGSPLPLSDERFMERGQIAKKRSAVDSGGVFTVNGCTPWRLNLCRAA